MSATGRLIGLKRHLRAEVVHGDATYLLSEHGVTAMCGTDVETVVPLLDGTRDLASVLRAATPGVAAAQVGQVVGALMRAGLVRYHGAERYAEEAYWDLAGLDGHAAGERLARARVDVIAVGDVDGAALATACGAGGLAAATHTGTTVELSVPGPAITIVACDDYLRPELYALDLAHRAAGRPWLLVKPVGATPWLGPVFQPGAGPCWSCLAFRLRANRVLDTPVRRTLHVEGPLQLPAATLGPVAAIGRQLAVLEAVKWLAGHRHDGQQAVNTFDSVAGAWRRHEVRRRPQCPSCGDPGLIAAQARRPVIARSQPKGSCAGTGHRARAPRDVLDEYGELVSPVTGVVRELRHERRGPAMLHCVVAGRNPAGRSLAELQASLRDTCGGKGVTPLDAEVSALCESLERYSGQLQGDELRVRDTFSALAADAVHPDLIQLYHPRQFADRERWNRTHSRLQWVCEPFDENAPIDWTPVWSLTRERHVLVPTGLAYFPGSACAEPVAGDRCTVADSNGNAAGSSREDAIVQGFLELAERDAVALWWYNRTRQPAIDLDAFAEPWIDELRAMHRALGREVWALDLTSDLGIPAVAAVSRRLDQPTEDIVLGFGAHFDPRLAVRRALAEVNQLLPAVLPVDGGGYAVDAPDAVAWWRTATVANQPYLLPDPAATGRGPADFEYRPRADLRDDVAAAVRVARAIGSELLVLDQTRPDIGLPVVKVIVPGLRHFWARFAPGRLYDVPVRLGRLDKPTRYDELNPLPMFL